MERFPKGWQTKSQEGAGAWREKARLGLTSSYASSAAGSECRRRVAAFAQPLNAFTTRTSTRLKITTIPSRFTENARNRSNRKPYAIWQSTRADGLLGTRRPSNVTLRDVRRWSTTTRLNVKKHTVYSTMPYGYYWPKCTAPTTDWSMEMRVALCAVYTGSNWLRTDCRHLGMRKCTRPVSPMFRIPTANAEQAAEFDLLGRSIIRWIFRHGS